MSRRKTTDTDLDAVPAFVGLMDFCLFAGKVTVCFTSDARRYPALAAAQRANLERKLAAEAG